MPQENQQRQPQMPPLKNVQFINTPVGISDRDEAGSRELNFIVGPTEQHSYALTDEAQVAVAKMLIEPLSNDAKRELLDALAPGIEVAQSVPQGVK